MRKAIRLALTLSAIMTATGSILIPIVQTLDPLMQNIIYRILSLPLMVAVAYGVYGGEK
jgi:uncharacterized protein YqhQ